MLAAALYLVQRSARMPSNCPSRSADRPRLGHQGRLGCVTAPRMAEFTELLAEYTATGTPLPMLEDHNVDRLADGWSADDPLLPVATGVLARQAGYASSGRNGCPHCANR